MHYALHAFMKLRSNAIYVLPGTFILFQMHLDSFHFCVLQGGPINTGIQRSRHFVFVLMPKMLFKKSHGILKLMVQHLFMVFVCFKDLDITFWISNLTLTSFCISQNLELPLEIVIIGILFFVYENILLHWIKNNIKVVLISQLKTRSIS